MKTAKLGYLYVTLAAVLWAVSGTSSKFLFSGGMTPFQLIQLRTTLAFVGLLLWLMLRGRSLLSVSPKDLFYFCFLGILGIGAAQFFYLFAISKINVAAAILLHYTGPVFVALYSVFILRKQLARRSILAIAGTLVGCFFVVGAYNVELLTLNRSGIIGGILAAMAFAAYSLLSEYGMRKYSPWTVLFYGLLFASLIWNILHPPLAAILQTHSPIQWWWILFIATLGTIIPFGLYFEGINLIRSTHASVTATLEPITAGIISSLFLGEFLSLLQILGGLLVIASIVMLQWKTEGDINAIYQN